MERRIFDLDINKLKRNCQLNTPSDLYLNFFQHLSYDYYEQRGNFDDFYFNRYIRNYFDWLEDKSGVEVTALGTGMKNGDRILKRKLVKEIRKD